jgi:uncharacterized protein (DUF4415 family)
MTGKSERIVGYTAEEIDAKLARGESRSRHVDRGEALAQRRADPEAPRPYPGWEETITVGLPRPKRHLNLRIDADVVDWFKAQRPGYQTRINAVLRAYVAVHRRDP